jgi:hypothetical protein
MRSHIPLILFALSPAALHVHAGLAVAAVNAEHEHDEVHKSILHKAVGGIGADGRRSHRHRDYKEGQPPIRQVKFADKVMIRHYDSVRHRHHY